MFGKRLAKATNEFGKSLYVNIKKKGDSIVYDLGFKSKAHNFNWTLLFASKKDIRIGLEKKFPGYKIEFVKGDY